MRLFYKNNKKHYKNNVSWKSAYGTAYARLYMEAQRRHGLILSADQRKNIACDAADIADEAFEGLEFA